MHADADVHMGNLSPLGSGERGELSAFAEHEVGTPTLDRLQERGQRGLRIDPAEHLADDKVVGLLERQGQQPAHDGAYAGVVVEAGFTHEPFAAGPRELIGAGAATRLRSIRAVIGRTVRYGASDE